MRNDDQDFEAFLRRFAPRTAAPLRVRAAPRTWRRPALAAAAALLVVGTALVARLVPAPGPPASAIVWTAPSRAISLRDLHALAHLEPGLLEDALDREARRLLPDVESAPGTLAILAAQ